MKIQALDSERLMDFVDYCRKHRKEVDDSFLYDEDLRELKLNEENPTYILLNDQNAITAAASLIIDDYNKRGKKARFRIFHSEIDQEECYNMLLKALLQHTHGLEKLNLFVPIVNERMMQCMESLGFDAERYSYLLVRGNQEVPGIELPEGYTIRPFVKVVDEEVWCNIRNIGFAKLKGSETPTTPEAIKKLTFAQDYIEDGMMMLCHKDVPIGVVRGSKDEYEDSPIMNIGPLAILPEYQGKGLGRMLLRASLNFAKQIGYKRTILCVNAENERAKALYLQEGFVQVEAVVCYKYEL